MSGKTLTENVPLFRELFEVQNSVISICAHSSSQLFFSDRSSSQNHESFKNAQYIWQIDVHSDGHTESRDQERVEDRLGEAH